LSTIFGLNDFLLTAVNFVEVMMVPIPQSISNKPEMSAGTTDSTNQKKKEADPLSFLANITEKVLGTPKGEFVTSESAPKPSTGGRASDKMPGRKPVGYSSDNAPALSKKAKKGKKTSKVKKETANKKRKRNKDEEDERWSPDQERPPVAQVVIHNNDDNSLHQEAGTVASALQDEYTEHFMAHAALSGPFYQQQPTTQAQFHQQLLLKERMMMMMMTEHPALSRISDNFLSRQYAALENEELELAALRRRREQVLLNMNNQDELFMRTAVAASNFNHPSLLGIGAGITNANNFGLAAVAAAGGPLPTPVALRSSASATSPAFRQHGFGDGATMMSAVAATAASMGYPPASLIGGIGSSPLLRALSAQNAVPSFQNPTIAAAAAFPANTLGAASDPAMAMSAAVGASSSLPTKPIATEDADAKRLAPARGVFDRNIKSNDDVIDSLARANMRLNTKDTKKSGQQRFRGYQCEQWTQKYQDLLEFKAEHGNW
jgi:hypothetical protein